MNSVDSILGENQIIKEINKHQWIESKKRGYIVGFEEAAEDWIIRHSDDWLKYRFPKKLERGPARKFQKRRFIYP